MFCATFNEPRFARIARLYLSWFLGLLAALTVLTHMAQAFGWSFLVYARCGLAVMIAASVLSVWQGSNRWHQDPPKSDGAASLAAGAIMIIWAILAISSFRPDADDYVYVPNAVYALANPESPLGFVVRGLVPSGGQTITSFNVAISLPFEYSQAILAHFTGLQYLDVYYLVMPALAGGAMAAAALYLTAQFPLSPLAAVLGCAVALAALLLMGETHRAFGNFSVTRAFQGKTLLLSVGIPVWTGATIAFFRQPRTSTWLLLLATGTAMLGATTSSIVVLSLLTLLLALAVAVTARGFKSLFAPTLLYGASLSYVAGYAVVFLATGYHRRLGSASPANLGWPLDFSGHFAFMVQPEQPVWLVMAAVALMVVLLLAERPVKLFVCAWTGLGVALYLNPVVAETLITYVTSPNHYWRLFYLLPVPLLISLAVAYVFDTLLKRGQRTAVGLAALGLLALAIAGHWWLPRASVFRAAELRTPMYKLPRAELAEARAILAAQPPPGPMLAPPTVSGIIPMLSTGHPQLLQRLEAGRLWLGRRNGEFIADQRWTAMNVVAGTESGEPAPQGFIAVVRDVTPGTIVFRAEAWARQKFHLRSELQRLGYGPARPAGSMVLLERSSL